MGVSFLSDDSFIFSRISQWRSVDEIWENVLFRDLTSQIKKYPKNRSNAWENEEIVAEK